jgi:hypothetical protein
MDRATNRGDGKPSPYTQDSTAQIEKEKRTAALAAVLFLLGERG